MSEASTEREFEVVVWGATGFTGKLVAEYLAHRYGCEGCLRWAIAGRNPIKLNTLREELGAPNLPILIAQSDDPTSLEQLAAQSQVICSSVGPYALYGTPLVEACTQQGTHYCDLSGEVPWMRRIIDQYQDLAQQNRVKIVHACGFDSIPSDMGVFFLQSQIVRQTGQFATLIKLGLRSAKGGVSGGTYASLSNVLAEANENVAIWSLLQDPYALNPTKPAGLPPCPDLSHAQYDKDFDSWVSPFIMASINTRIVRRSHALAGFPYGKNFRYEEFVLNGTGIKGRLSGFASGLPVKLADAAKPNTLLKRLMDRVLPKPGQGPSRRNREKGFFKFYILGKTETGDVFRGKICGDRDPGYGATSKMLAESAVSLAQDTLPDTYGVLSPATAMGEALLIRLCQRAGMRFELAI